MKRQLAIVVTALALAACPGNKNKNDQTTPGGGGGGGGVTDPNGMGDGNGGGGGDTAGPDGGGGGGTGGNGGSVKPQISAPNLDPTPEQAKAVVDMHLRAARQMLSASTPDPDGALKEAKLALDADAASVDAAVVVAHAYYHKRLYDTAEVMLDELLKRPSAKENPSLFYVYGLVYDKLGKKAEARLAYETAVRLDGTNASARINLGVHQLANKQYDEAIATYEKVVSLGRDDAEVENALGAAYRGRSGDFTDAGSSERTRFIERAKGAFEKAKNENPNYGPALYNLGLLYLDADPFPTSGGKMDTLDRLQKAKQFFDAYKNAPGVDIKLFDERTKDVDKQIKREEKLRKRAEKEAKAAAKEAAGGN